ncbi:MAG: A/G-specific adenine glycosylase [Planctomycetes bacterium]|nr:A/G-specific adenine glycosylase [Planctomycetota bacterium]
MNSSANRRIRAGLLAWFRANARDLPWRGARDPYRVWLSEVLLQQTRVETVIPYYERFIAAFPRVEDLAAADEDRVLKLWEGLGYYTRARNLMRAARIIARERGGRFPETAEDWRALPGIGPYTAGAIASIAFGERAAAVDGNVLRVLARILAVDDPIDDARTRASLARTAETLVPARDPGDFNQALMDLGATICVPRRPHCDACPIARSCRARAAGRQADLPARRPKPKVPHREMVAAAIRRRGRFLIAKRRDGGLLGGLWEFPSGEVLGNEAHAHALSRIAGDLGLGIRAASLVASVDHAYSHFTQTLHLYVCDADGGRARAKDRARVRWVPRAGFEGYAFPTVQRRALAHL